MLARCSTTTTLALSLRNGLHTMAFQLTLSAGGKSMLMTYGPSIYWLFNNYSVLIGVEYSA